MSYYDVWLQRRLARTNYTQGLPASVRVDLARDENLDDDEFDQALSALDPSYIPDEHSFGISDLIHEFMSREPKKVPVNDIKSMQTKMIEQGYLHQSSSVDGFWSPAMAGAYRRMENDVNEQIFAGKRPGSATTAQALRYLGYMTPNNVWQGVVGTAKGIAEGAQQSAEGGALIPAAAGGAAAAAGAGAAVAAGLAGSTVVGLPLVPVAAAVGAVAGGVWGFVSDWFGDDKDEEGQSGLEKTWDALTPFPEYAGEAGAQMFFNDVNTILTASTVVRGGAMAIRGIGAGARAMGAAEGAVGAIRGGAAQLGRVTWRTNLQKAAWGVSDDALRAKLLSQLPGQGTPSIFARALTPQTTKGVIGRGVIGGAAGGLITGEQEGIVAGALGGLGLGAVGRSGSAWMRNWMVRNGALAQASRPLLQSANSAFTGLAAGVLETHLVSDVLPGISPIEKSLDKEVGLVIDETGAIKDVSKMPGETPLEWLGLALYPTQMLTVKGGAVADKLAQSKLLRERFNKPYLDATWGARDENGKLLLGNRLWETTQDAMTPTRYKGTGKEALAQSTSDLQFRLSMGVDAEIEAQALEQGLPFGSKSFLEFAEPRRLELNRLINAGFNGDEDGLAKIKELLTWSVGKAGESSRGPTFLSAWLSRLGSSRGRGVLQGMQEQVDAEVIAGNVNSLLGEYATARAANKSKKYLDELAKGLNAADRKKLDNIADDGMTIQIANRHIPEQGIWGAPTQEEITDIVDKLRAAKGRLKTLADQNFTPQTVQTQRGPVTQFTPVSVGREMDDILAQLVNPDQAHMTTNLLTMHELRGLIPQEMRDDALKFLTRDEALKYSGKLERNTNATKFLQTVIDHLEGVKTHFATEIKLGDNWGLPATKRFVARNGDAINWYSIPEKLAMQNLDEFTRAPNKWDSIAYFAQSVGLSPTRHSDLAFFKLRRANQESVVNEEIRALAERSGKAIPLSGKGIMTDLHDWMGKYNVESVPQNVFMLRKDGKWALPIVDAGQITPKQIKSALNLDEVLPGGLDPDDLADTIYAGIKRGQALGGEMDFIAHPLESFHSVAHNLRVSGMPGFVDFARTWHVKRPAAMGAVGGGIIGAGAGFEEDGFKGALTKGLIGAGVGATLTSALGKKWPKGHYAYLPDHLHKASIYARYTFSLAFDIGRWMENATLSSTREGLPFVLNAPRHIEKVEGASLFRGGTVSGAGAKEEMMELARRMHGTNELEVIDETMTWFYQRGITGYSPRLQEQARAYMIARADKAKGINVLSRDYMAQLENRVRMLEGYGVGRRTWEKSVNFVFFPFSFQKKFVTSLADFVMQAPARALMIHEGYRRFHEWGADDRLREWVQKHAPILEQAARFNNLAFGISPGRFFLEGMFDDKGTAGHKTMASKLVQGLTSVFVPGGSNTPIAQAFGGLGDVAVHAFSPYVVTGEHPVDQAFKVIQSFIPAVRDITRIAESGGQTIQAATQGGAPYWQQQQYMLNKRALKGKYEPIAQALGYVSADSMLNSPRFAALKMFVDQREVELAGQFPVGAEMSSQFENPGDSNEALILGLQQRPDKTPAETAILELVEIDRRIPLLVEATGLTTTEVKRIMQGALRRHAMEFVEDEDFKAMYDRFFFSDYGPLERMAA